MFERFSDRARRVVVLAQEEARMLNHNYIGTEHILLGLLHAGDGDDIATRALNGFGVELGPVRRYVERQVGRGTKGPPGHIPFTPRAKKVLELSLREALQLRHNYIGTEHILLGLIRESDGLAAQALLHAEVHLDRLRERVLAMVAAGPRDKPPEPYYTSGPTLVERLTRIEESLERIERHLGIAPAPGGTGERPTAEESGTHSSETPEAPPTAGASPPSEAPGTSEASPAAGGGDRPGDRPGGQPGDRPGEESGERPGDRPDQEPGEEPGAAGSA
ncbi:Clp protease [Nonomuraea sp. RK-328]|nr:Clp protease [Nonomuraea sp. RK-328]